MPADPAPNANEAPEDRHGPLSGHTLYAATVAGCCHAFEPDPVAREALEANLRLNPDLARRVVVHAEAVAAHPGPVRLGNITSGRGATACPACCSTGLPPDGR